MDKFFGEEVTGMADESNWRSGKKYCWLRDCPNFSQNYQHSPREPIVGRQELLHNRYQAAFNLNNVCANAVELLNPEGTLFSSILHLRREYSIKLEILPVKIKIRLLRYPEYATIMCPLHENFDSIIHLRRTSPKAPYDVNSFSKDFATVIY